jgi:WD40 repeat protein
MFKKMLFLLLVLFAGTSSLFAGDPVDTVWSVRIQEGVRYYKLSPDNRYIAVVPENTLSSPKKIKLLDPETGELIREIDGWEPYDYTDLDFSPDSRYLAIGGSGNRIVVWDLDSNRVEKELIYDSTAKDAFCGRFSPTGDTIVFISKGKIIFMDFHTNEVLQEFESPLDFKGYVIDAKYSPAGNKIAWRFWAHNYIFMYDILLGQWLKITKNKYNVNDINFSNDGSKLIFCDDTSSVYILNTADTSLAHYLNFSEYWDVCKANIFSNNDSTLIISGWNWGMTEAFNILVINYYDSLILKNFDIWGTNFQVPGNNNFLFFSSTPYLTKIGLDWTQGIIFKDESGSKFTIKPNPLNGKGTLLLDNFNSEHSVISLYDTNGKLIRKLFDGVPGGNSFELEFDTSGISKGMYYCTVNTGSARKVIKLIVE